MDAVDFVAHATEFLKSNYNIIIFPEGTRTVSGRKVHLHRGFAYLHLASKAPILPIHIENMPQILGKRQPWYDIGSRTSVYTLTLKDEIIYEIAQDQAQRDAAINVTQLAQRAIFES
jgi:1-acyl-sn-glycerol-3-phosphate acyltransferase